MDFIGHNDISIDKKMAIISRSKDLDLSKLGNFSGFKNKFLSEQEDEEICKILLSTAMNKGIGGGVTERAHCIRELAPQLDFVDGHNKYLKNNRWYQTINTLSKMSDTNIGVAYQTSKETKIDQKVICFYGVHIPKDCDSVYEIQLWLKNRKLVERLFIYNSEKSVTQLLRYPWILGVNQNDYHEIHFQCSNNYSNSKIKLLGYVDESLGTNIM